MEEWGADHDDVLMLNVVSMPRPNLGVSCFAMCIPTLPRMLPQKACLCKGVTVPTSRPIEVLSKNVGALIYSCAVAPRLKRPARSALRIVFFICNSFL